ncbi:MAG TPA: glutamyl-tRNA reductase [Candidatus Binatia bacterium]
MSVNRDIIIVGLNHRTAPIEVRERVAVEESLVPTALRTIRALRAVEESAVLSTCNRVEVVAATSDRDAAFTQVKKFLLDQESASSEKIVEEHLYAYAGGEAVRHLFRVAASLDSMVVGEPQILGQLKAYYSVAQETGSVGAILHRLFHRSFTVAKRVRTETGIASRAVSIGSVAVELAKRIFDRLQDKTVMLIGAGKMGHLVARQLKSGGVSSLMVTNRTFETAVETAAEFEGNPIRFEELHRYLKLADLVVGCAAAPDFLLKREAVEETLRERKHEAMFFIDLGDRRNFDPRINALSNVYLYDIDDLQAVAQENLDGRAGEVDKAERIVDEEVESFLGWLDSLDQVPTIVALKERLETIRRSEIEKSMRTSLKELSEKERRAIDDMTSAMIGKILHGPISRLKRPLDGEEEALYVEALRKLFGLDEK